MAGQEQVIDANVEARMTDNGNNQYSYTYAVTRPGKVTISVLKYVAGRVYSEYYPTRDHTLLSDYNTYSSNINFYWGYGAIYNGRSTYLSALYYFKLLPPYTATYYFSSYVYDEVRFKLDSSMVVQRT